MASTYSTNLALDLMANGDQSGTWGTTTNTNLGTLIEQAISGYVTQAITDGSGANTTITIPNGATGVARNMVIEMTGALTFSTTSLIVPANKKLYFIFNNTTGGFAVTVKVSGQTGVLVPNGKKVILTSNGTDIVEAHTAIVGNATMGGTLGITGTTTAAAINASGTVAMAGAATVGTTLGITGTTTAAAINASGTVAMAGAATVGTTLGVTGATTLSSTLGVTGNITVGAGSKFTTDAGNDLNLDAPSSRSLFLKIGGSTKVTVDNAGAVSMSSTLSVTGTSTMAAINASGSLSLTGALVTIAPAASNPTLFINDPTKGSAMIQGGVNTGATALGDYWVFNVPTSRGLSWAVNNSTVLNALAAGVTIPGTLGVTGTSTMAAINASGVIASTANFITLTNGGGATLILDDTTANMEWRLNAGAFGAWFSIYNLDRASHDLKITSAGAVTIPGVTTIGAASAGVGTLTINNAVQPTIYLAKTDATATTWQIYNNGNLGFSDGTNTPLYFTGAASIFSGTLGVSTGAAVGGATPGAGGLAFPATAVAVADANTLDDYEEGTWTPSQGSGLTVVGAFSSSGTYIKIGKSVTVLGLMQGATSVAMGAVGILTANLPFTAANTASLGIGGTQNSTLTQIGACYANSNTTTVYSSAMAATPGIYFSITYFATA